MREIGIEFEDKERLTEFFQKARGFYPASVCTLSETISRRSSNDT
jgi:hypothetical protein